CQLRFDQAGLAPARLKQEVSQTRHLIPLLQTFPSAIEACSAFTHVMACTLAESPCDPLHRKLRQLRCLRCRVDCYRVERTSSRAGVSPAEVQRLSRRTFSTTNSPNTCRGIYFVVHEVVDGKGNRMTKRYLVIATAWWLHAASWFLPAIKGFLGSRLDH